MAKCVSESFLLFSQSIPSRNLGFVDSKASILEITVGDRDLTIHQSPTILSSNRSGGTTGAGKLIPKLSVHTGKILIMISCLEDHSIIRIVDHLAFQCVV